MLRLLWITVLSACSLLLRANPRCSFAFRPPVHVVTVKSAEVKLLSTPQGRIELQVPQSSGQPWKLIVQVLEKHLFASAFDETVMEEELLLAELKVQGFNTESIAMMSELASSLVPGMTITHVELWQQLIVQTKVLRSQIH